MRSSSPPAGPRWSALVHVAFLPTGHRQDAEDLLQSALERVALRWQTLDEPEAYTRKVLYTQAISRRRRLGRRPAEALTGQPPETALVVEREVKTRIVLEAALETLTPKQRAVLVLRFYEDLSESQTADVLGCSLGTVK
ncbi:MAG TPA: sigma-70 family RNA polymerase sigma factor [Candidatus Limnocylindrales bacterium]|nr:sigma-70 family RNA polymerase sigma factor [Candidatus Limnocylindrales bacterium]